MAFLYHEKVVPGHREVAKGLCVHNTGGNTQHTIISVTWQSWIWSLCLTEEMICAKNLPTRPSNTKYMARCSNVTRVQLIHVEREGELLFQLASLSDTITVRCLAWPDFSIHEPHPVIFIAFTYCILIMIM